MERRRAQLGAAYSGSCAGALILHQDEHHNRPSSYIRACGRDGCVAFAVQVPFSRLRLVVLSCRQLETKVQNLHQLVATGRYHRDTGRLNLIDSGQLETAIRGEPSGHLLPELWAVH